MQNIIDFKGVISKTPGMLTLIVVLGLVVACPRPGLVPAETPGQKVWPPPPAQARIRYVTSITGPHDLGIGTSFFHSIYRYLAGQDRPAMVAPFTVTTDDRNRIYVVDSFLRKIHVFDPNTREYRLIPETNELRSPVDIAVDQETGRIFVSDSQLKVVKIYTPKGQAAGPDIGGGTLGRPTGLALMPDTNELLVADTRKGKLYRFDSSDGRILGTIGEPGTGDGELHFPTHLSVGPDGSIHVTDAMNFRVQRFKLHGQWLGTFGQAGNSRGDFARPRGVATDSQGRIYVVDALFDNIQIFDSRFRLLMALGRPGQAPGQFWLPAGIHIDNGNRIYVADTYNKRIQIFELLNGQDQQP